MGFASEGSRSAKRLMRLAPLKLALELPPRGLVLGDAVPLFDSDVDGAVREGAVLGGVPPSGSMNGGVDLRGARSTPK